jgi:Protein of unknown function (DUF1326)
VVSTGGPKFLAPDVSETGSHWYYQHHGNCCGFEVIRIDRGHFGEVPLDGLCAALVYAWPGPIFEGNGEMQAIIDERRIDGCDRSGRACRQC